MLGRNYSVCIVPTIVNYSLAFLKQEFMPIPDYEIAFCIKLFLLNQFLN